MADTILMALFKHPDDARRAEESLHGLGLRRDQIDIIGREALEGHLGDRAGGSATTADPDRIEDPERHDPELIRLLAAQGMAEREARTYARVLSGGGMMLVVRTGTDMVGRVAAVLDYHRPAALDRNLTPGHAADWTVFDEAAGPYGAVQVSDDLLHAEPVEPAGETAARGNLHRAAEQLRAASTAPEPGSAAGGAQAKLVRAGNFVTGTPSPAQSEAPEVGANKPGARERREDERG